MSLKHASRVFSGILILALGTGLLTFQRGGFRSEDDDELYSGDSSEKTEWAFARLHYNGYSGPAGCFRGGGSRWLVDAPAADRHFAQGVRRLTRIHTTSVEQFVDPASDDLFNWPWTYAVEVGSWTFTDDQAKRIRDFLFKGGFLMVDDFHGTCEWSVFLAGIQKILPDRRIEDLQDQDEIFHVLYDLEGRFQVPGAQFLYTNRLYERDGVNAKWGAIRDDKGRIIVAICHNMDLGDAWEWADRPQYPERYTSLAYRVGTNYIIYSMTH